MKNDLNKQELINLYSLTATIFLLTITINFHLPELFLCILLLFKPVEKNLVTCSGFAIITLIYLFELSHHVIPYIERYLQ